MDVLGAIGVAGDIGSALGGLALATFGIDWYSRKRSQQKTDRVQIAHRLDGVSRATNALQDDFKQWVMVPGAMNDAEMVGRWVEATAPLQDIDYLTTDRDVRRVAQEIQSMVKALEIRMRTIGSLFKTRHPLLDHYHAVDLQLTLYRFVLAEDKGDPASIISAHVSLLMTWEQAVNEGLFFYRDHVADSE